MTLLRSLALSASFALAGCVAEAAPDPEPTTPAVGDVVALEAAPTLEPRVKKLPPAQAGACYRACMAGAGPNPTWYDDAFCGHSCY
jgi:hypothetical protein